MEIISNNKTAVNTITVEFKATAEEFENAIQAAYLRKRHTITIPGFRKGKATRKLIEKSFGEGVFYEDAVNSMYQRLLAETAEQLNLEVIDVPNIEVLSVDKNEGVTYKADYTVKPEVSVKEYKGLKAAKTVKTIGDEDINTEIEKMQEKNARIIDVDDRACENGDIAVFDFKGSVDGNFFEGGSAEDFELEIGSGRFIPGFEEQMIGKSIGEEFDVNVTFPEDYNAEELKGKAAVFNCKINKLQAKELPEIDDEFVKDVSEFDTIDELKADIRSKLEEAAEKQAEVEFDRTVSEQVIANLEAEVPAVMFENRITDLVKDWDYRNRSQGISVEDYLKYTGATMEQFRENFRAPAESQVKMRLALEKIVELENIDVPDEDVEAEFAKLAELHKMDIEKVKQLIPAENLKNDLKVDKAFNFVKENVVAE